MEGDSDDDEGLGNIATHSAIENSLGKERRDSVLTSLYLSRSDPTNVVRQVSLQVWKSIVSNTPRTLRELLPVLMAEIIQFLASEQPEKKHMGGKSLGDVVRKLGDRVMNEIIPVLQVFPPLFNIFLPLFKSRMTKNAIKRGFITITYITNESK